jgi:hypothetical protein
MSKLPLKVILTICFPYDFDIKVVYDHLYLGMMPNYNGLSNKYIYRQITLAKRALFKL